MGRRSIVVASGRDGWPALVRGTQERGRSPHGRGRRPGRRRLIYAPLSTRPELSANRNVLRGLGGGLVGLALLLGHADHADHMTSHSTRGQHGACTGHGEDHPPTAHDITSATRSAPRERNRTGHPLGTRRQKALLTLLWAIESPERGSQVV